MIVRGRALVHAPCTAVFDAICDPGALLEVIPGCREVRRVAADEYRGRIALRLPAIVGTYETVVRLLVADRPTFGSFEGRVAGRPGAIEGRASFRLEPVAGDGDGAADDEGTVIEYEGDGMVTGPLARLDARFVEGLARSLIDEGLARLERRLRGTSAVSGADGRP